MDEYNI